MKNSVSHSEFEDITCDLCAGKECVTLFKARDYRFGRKEEYNFVKCSKCGLIYLNPRPTPAWIAKLYEADYTPDNTFKPVPKLEKRKWVIILKKAWHKLNGKYVDEIISKAEGNVLDISCGRGHLLLLLKHKGCEAYGIELNTKAAKICGKLGLKIFCGVLEDAPFSKNFFDTVIMSQVLEHLPSPKANLAEVFKILRPGGKVYIYCPNGESYLSKFFGKYWHGWHIPFHFYAFTKKTIRHWAEETGFIVVKINTVTPDNFFIVSLKSYLYGDKESAKRPIERGRILDIFWFRAMISFTLRILDLISPGKGDCLKIELRKRPA